MPLLSMDTNVIRSPKSQSFHLNKSDIKQTMAGIYKNSIVNTAYSEYVADKPKSQTMSRALQLCAIEEIANTFRKKMKEWKNPQKNTSINK